MTTATKTSDTRTSLNNFFPGRQVEIDTLITLLGQPTDPHPSTILISGPPATGKTSLLRSLLSAPHYPYPNHVAWLNCIDRHTPRLLFESALNQLSGTDPRRIDDGGNFAGYARCDNVNDFAWRVGELCRAREGGDEVRRFLVFDKAERLREMSPTLLPALLKLQEQTRCPITIILISHIPWDALLTRTHSIDPSSFTIVPFRPYQKSDILPIISRDCPPEEDTDFFLKFVEMIYDVFQRPCKDLNELRHLVALLFPKYVEPVLAGKVTRQQTGKLFAHIQYHIKEALHSIYLREISSSEWQKTSEIKDPSQPVARPALYDVELPFYTKFLLIAAFLASYNPPRLDVRYFSRIGDDTKKRKSGKGRVKKAEGGGKMRQQLLGPKAFPVERMLAIFYSIVEEGVESNVDIQTQVASLFSLRLLQRVTPMDRLDGVKCKCNVSFEFIQKVGQTVKFDVSKYLFDFV